MTDDLLTKLRAVLAFREGSPPVGRPPTDTEFWIEVARQGEHARTAPLVDALLECTKLLNEGTDGVTRLVHLPWHTRAREALAKLERLTK